VEQLIQRVQKGIEQENEGWEREAICMLQEHFSKKERQRSLAAKVGLFFYC